MKLYITNEERAALATLLIPAAWGAPEEDLGHLLDAYDAMSMDDYKGIFDGQKFNFTEKLINKAETIIELTEGSVNTLLRMFPGAATPGLFGPPKVRLLRKLRALVPKETEAQTVAE